MTHAMEAYFNDIVDAVCKTVRFDSSLKPAEEGCPFGKETADCLNYYLSLAKEMGFETHNYDNYVGEVIFGEGEELAVLAHLDVVPAGDGWRFPPFAAVINDELSAGGVPGVKIWGRGTMDDKGPAVAVLYCLKALKDEGFRPKRKIKLIVGCNEENGWACLEHYNKVTHMPEEGFSPDASFPAIYAEKGILHFTARFPMADPPFRSLSAAAPRTCLRPRHGRAHRKGRKEPWNIQKRISGHRLFLRRGERNADGKGKIGARLHARVRRKRPGRHVRLLLDDKRRLQKSVRPALCRFPRPEKHARRDGQPHHVPGRRRL